MTRRTLTTIGCPAMAGLFVFVMAATPALAADEGTETSSKAVTMDQVPKAAQKTIKKEVGKNEIKELEEKVIDGKTVYAAAWLVDGKEVEVQVAADGKVTFRKSEAAGAEEGAAEEKPKAEEKAEAEGEGQAEGKETSSEAVTMDQVPKAVQKTIKKEAGKNEIKELEEKVIDGKKVYEASWVVDGQEIEVQVAPDGKVINKKSEAAAGGEEAKADEGEKPAKADEFRSKFDVDKKNLASKGRNPYFPLVPGYKITLAKGREVVVVSVLNETKTVDGVECRIVEERESAEGNLKEISRNYFAIDKTTKDLYYVGEDVDVYADGKVSGHGGAWLSGVKGAKFGLMLPGAPKVGDKYYQEVAPKVAMDRAEIVKLGAALETPLKKFENVLYAKETTPLEAGVSRKWYAKGVGIIGDDALRAIRVEKPQKPKKAEEAAK